MSEWDAELFGLKRRRGGEMARVELGKRRQGNTG